MSLGNLVLSITNSAWQLSHGKEDPQSSTVPLSSLSFSFSSLSFRLLKERARTASPPCPVLCEWISRGCAMGMRHLWFDHSIHHLPSWQVQKGAEVLEHTGASSSISRPVSLGQQKEPAESWDGCSFCCDFFMIASKLNPQRKKASMEVERTEIQQMSGKVMGWMAFPTPHFRLPNWEH